MAETERFALARVLQVLVPIAEVAIALVGLLLTLAARRKELACVYLGSDKLVSLEGGPHPGIIVQFQEQGVTSLVKMKFVLRNVGSTAIKGEDVKEPIELYFPKEVKVLNSLVERTAPAEFKFQAPSDPGRGVVTCEFFLLNSGDEAYFSVYTYNSEPKRPEVRGRIVDVKRIQSLDESQSQSINPFPFTSNVGVRKVLYRIPDKPGSLYEDWKSFLGGTLVFLVLSMLFASSTVFIYFSPSGY